jgi:hypothetical protein
MSSTKAPSTSSHFLSPCSIVMPEFLPWGYNLEFGKVIPRENGVPSPGSNTRVHSPTFAWRAVLCPRKVATGFWSMIVVFPSPNHSPGSDTRQSPCCRATHSGAISSESVPGCLVGFAVGVAPQLARRSRRRMNNEMMHSLFMIFLVRQPSASAAGRGTSSFYGYLNYCDGDAFQSNIISSVKSPESPWNPFAKIN